MNAHRPIISFIQNKTGNYHEQKFRVEFEDEKLLLSGTSTNEEGVIMTYTRIDEIP